MNTTKYLRLFGRVQGVSFRASLCQEARKRQINGWVRNRQDGSLEAMLQGDPAAVESLIAWARRGPPGALVERIDTTEGQGIYEGFASRPNV